MTRTNGRLPVFSRGANLRSVLTSLRDRGAIQMSVPRSVRRWLRMPSRVALVLGLGALPTAVARADTAEEGGQTACGEVLIRIEGGRIYLTEGGREAELPLTATPQRDHLLRLLAEHGPGEVKLDRDPRLIMSSGGGSGFYWWGARKPAT